jgi:hypothetical protein
VLQVELFLIAFDIELIFLYGNLYVTMLEKFQNTKGKIRSCKWKKDGQYNGKKKSLNSFLYIYIYLYVYYISLFLLLTGHIEIDRQSLYANWYCNDTSISINYTGSKKISTRYDKSTGEDTWGRGRQSWWSHISAIGKVCVLWNLLPVCVGFLRC